MHIRPCQAQLQATRQSVHYVHSPTITVLMCLVMWMREWTPVVKDRRAGDKIYTAVLLYTRCNPIIH